MNKTKEHVSILGAGSWGTTLAIILSRKKIPVRLFSVFEEQRVQMKHENENSLYLKGVPFPHDLSVADSLEQAMRSRIIVIAIPVKYIPKILKKIKKLPYQQRLFLSVSKGIESKTLKTVSQMIDEVLGDVAKAVLSGPNIAREVLQGVPTATIIAGNSEENTRVLQSLFTTETFRVYTHHDILGVELGGALKNIIAIACGIADGLGFGSNTKAALITRGIIEIIRLGKHLGADPSTFWGISGLGDVVTTCFSPHSRNRFVGEALGKGERLGQVLANMNMVAEGVLTAKSAYLLSKQYGIDMPITQEVYAILFRRKSPTKAVSDLMKRPLKEEMIKGRFYPE